MESTEIIIETDYDCKGDVFLRPRKDGKRYGYRLQGELYRGTVKNVYIGEKVVGMTIERYAAGVCISCKLFTAKGVREKIMRDDYISG